VKRRSVEFLLTLAAAALVANATTALAVRRPGPPAPRVCCRARFPDRGDTIRFGSICADVPSADTAMVRVTR
jgi:hypothetical protein